MDSEELRSRAWVSKVLVTSLLHPFSCSFPSVASQHCCAMMLGTAEAVSVVRMYLILTEECRENPQAIMSET